MRDSVQSFRGALRRVLLPVLLLSALSACESVEDRVARHYGDGLAQMAAAEPGKALIAFRNALKLDPNHAGSWHQVGLILEREARLEEAFAHFRKAAELDPALVPARLKLAEYYTVSNALDDATKDLEAVLAIEDGNADALALGASVAVRRGDLAAARVLLDRAKAVAPESLRVRTAEIGYTMALPDVTRALALIDAAIAAHPGEIGFHQIKVQVHEQAGDMPAIGATLRAMVAAFPDSLPAREALTLWALRTGDAAETEAGLRALAAAEPSKLSRVVDLVRFLIETQGVEAGRAEIAARIAAEPGRAEFGMMLAEFELQRGTRERAFEVYAGLAAQPGKVGTDARLALARLHVAAGDMAAADREIATVLAADPKNVGALGLRAMRLIDGGDLAGALRETTTGLQEAPDDPVLLELAARAQERSGKPDLANDFYAKAVRAAAYESAIALRYADFLGRISRITAAETVLSEAVRRKPGDAALLERLAGVRLLAGNWAGVEAAAAALEPLDPERARQIRAAALIQQERFGEGIEALGLGGLSAERKSAAMVQVLDAFLRAGEQAQAEAFLEGLIAENPEDLVALGLRGNLFLAAGRPEAAAEKYRAILAIDPRNAGAKLGLARVAEATGDLAAAATVLAEALTLTPDNLLLLLRLAQYRERQARVDEAIEIYERLYQAVPDSVLVANNLASLLADHRTDDPKAVARAVAIAGRLQGAENIALRDTYGWTRHLAGENNAALQILLPVIAALPEDPWVNYHIGMVYAALKRTEEARKHLEAALRFAGEEPFPPRETIKAKLAELRPA